MNTLTLWQPYASLVMAGIKNYETRSRSTKIRGKIAIHAAVRNTHLFGLPKGVYVFNEINKHAAAIILKAFPSDSFLDGYSLEHLPRGVILGTVELADCFRIIENNPSEKTAILENGCLIQGDEYLFGNYEVGRFAWQIENPTLFETPVPAKGKQGWWNWDNPCLS